MISLLTPTRGRPDSFQRMQSSAFDLADDPGEIEVIAYIDADDKSYNDLIAPRSEFYISEKREPLSKLFQMCYEKASGPIYMSCDDDVVFRTKGWDTMVRDVFMEYPDKLVMVYGDDGDPNQEKNHGAHPFIHQRWVDVVGRYLPPYFRGDFCDTWLNDLADGIGRKVKIDAYFEHLHPAFDKGVMDETRQEKIDHHFANNMPDVYYKDTVLERQQDINKLKAAINAKT